MEILVSHVYTMYTKFIFHNNTATRLCHILFNLHCVCFYSSITVGSGFEQDLNPGDPRIVVGGESNEWLNITRTLVSAGAEVPDNGIYMCEVCTDRSQECHTSNVTLQVIGEQPFIDEAVDSGMLHNVMYYSDTM